MTAAASNNASEAVAAARVVAGAHVAAPADGRRIARALADNRRELAIALMRSLAGGE